MKKILVVLIALSVMIPVAAIAKKDKDLMGTYAVRGYNPGMSTSGTPNYTGTLQVAQSNGAYLLTWTVGEGKTETYNGVGVYANGILSAGFKNEKGAGGVVSYKVEKNTLKGVWAPWAGGAFGFEIAERQ